MNTEYVTGFVKTAMDLGGLTQEAAIGLLKVAAEADPAVAQAAGVGAGVGAQPPGAIGAGQPPLPGDPSQGQGGIPPELEQMIASLPPEVLQQLLAELEQEAQGQGGQGMPPQGMPPQGGPPQGGQGGPPPSHHQKQGSHSQVLAKTAEYADGFFKAASYNGLNQRQATELYKKAVALSEASPIDPTLVIDTQEKRAAHFEGFVKAAMYNGATEKVAVDCYRQTFLK
jgi:hypothetical protein